LRQEFVGPTSHSLPKRIKLEKFRADNNNQHSTGKTTAFARLVVIKNTEANGFCSRFAATF
jgi:hypothetical protein